MRKRLLTIAVAIAGVTAPVAAVVMPAAASATSADRTCYSLGVPGQDHYEYCTFLPVDPGGIIR